MQKSPLANPLLDVAVATTEAQLKYWQALQVEGAAFIAKRMRADLEYLRALGHCTDPKTICDCHLAWFKDARKDYGEEWARLAGTLFSLGVSEIAPIGAGFARPRARASNGLAPATDGPLVSP
ncbi:MAG: hypothetical protein ACRECX_07345 [Methyloceanibacter sp.]|uniref:hypothetical protein n=1 Tax=Methyloceanibacter sp. TaxID=1965321 RepID=UPI003D6D33DA